MKEKIGMKGIKKSLFSVLLAMAVAISLMPAMTLTARAADIYDLSESNIQWELNDGSLTIEPIDPAKSAVLPDEGKGLPYYPWYNEDLKTIIIEPGVTGIGRSAFTGKIKLTSVSIPDGIVSIGESAFENSWELTGITLPESLTTIGESAFESSGLTTITIPANVTSIERVAFKDCNSLTEVKMNRSTPPEAEEDNIFEGCSNLTAIYVPNGSVAKYKAAKNWSTCKDKFVGSFNSATSNMTEITLDNEDLSVDVAKKVVSGISGYTPKDGDMVAFGYYSDNSGNLGKSGYKVMTYRSNSWGYTETGFNILSLDDIIDNVTAGVTAGYDVYAIGTIKKPSRPSSSGGGSYYTPPATNATISGETGSATNVSVDTSGGQATVTDISKNTVDSIANSNANGSDIVLDVSKAGNSQVTKVTLTKSTVENISKALDSGDNNKTNLVVKTGNAEVTFDAAAVKAIAEQASAGNIQIVVENTTGANLNNSQKKVVEDLGKGNGEKQVVQTFEASIISGGKKISNFMGGNVTVAQINFTVPTGKKASNYHIYYIPTSGAAERCNTWVKDGRIYFVTGHFSDYVIVYDETVSNGEGVPVYRLYHEKLGDHLLTTNAAERDAVQKIGYKFEGVGFYASGTGNKVYRLYNGNSGEHFYTASEKERDLCKENGWRFEGVAFITEGEKKVYRLYNGKVHFFTTSEKEMEFCIAYGWKLEAVGYTAN